jgi:hypothetical protein
MEQVFRLRRPAIEKPFGESGRKPDQCPLPKEMQQRLHEPHRKRFVEPDE